ncbi:hypothetical protein G9A89_002456 [Geosiphon pyriformis]|nr:hypothetical protein G9A89_002456 [Geosiphon pyriformis]
MFKFSPRPLGAMFIDKIQVRSFCGFINLKAGVYLITITALLNKISGFYGVLLLFYGGGVISVISYIYSILTAAVFGYSLYGISKDDQEIILFYSQFYWVDLAINTIFTLVFACHWYFVNDHAPLAKDAIDLPSTQYTKWKNASPSSLPAWKAESTFAVLFLLVASVVHIYFAIVVRSFALKKCKNFSSSAVISPRLSTSGDALLYTSNSSHSIRIDSSKPLAFEGIEEEEN